MGIIYKITNTSNNVYVGKTELTFEERMYDYKCNRFTSKKSHIRSSLKKYGFDAHIFEIIEVVDDAILSEREIYWVDKLKTYAYEYKDGMNLTKGGDGQRHSWKNDTERVEKARIRFSGENNPFFGKKLPKEMKEKISKTLKEHHKKNNYKFPAWVKELSRKKLCKPVVCYNSNGEFIGEYESIVSAANNLGVKRRTAIDAANGKQTHVNGFIIKHKTDNYPLKIEVGVLNKRPAKKPVIAIYNGIETEYPSKIECSKELGVPEWRIMESAIKNDRKPTKAGYIFVYKENYG